MENKYYYDKYLINDYDKNRNYKSKYLKYKNKYLALKNNSNNQKVVHMHKVKVSPTLILLLVNY